MSRTLWRFLDRDLLPSEHIEAKVMEFLRKGVLSKRQTINGQGQELVTTELNFSHPLVLRALPDGPEVVWVEEVEEEVLVPNVNLVAAAHVADEIQFEAANGIDDEAAERTERSGYQRRFSNGNGALRGRANYMTAPRNRPD